jgi:hypothetical protein
MVRASMAVAFSGGDDIRLFYAKARHYSRI